MARAPDTRTQCYYIGEDAYLGFPLLWEKSAPAYDKVGVITYPAIKKTRVSNAVLDNFLKHAQNWISNPTTEELMVHYGSEPAPQAKAILLMRMARNGDGCKLVTEAAESSQEELVVAAVWSLSILDCPDRMEILGKAALSSNVAIRNEAGFTAKHLGYTNFPSQNRGRAGAMP